jgi:hypothetical protein
MTVVKIENLFSLHTTSKNIMHKFLETDELTNKVIKKQKQKKLLSYLEIVYVVYPSGTNFSNFIRIIVLSFEADYLCNHWTPGSCFFINFGFPATFI